MKRYYFTNNTHLRFYNKPQEFGLSASAPSPRPDRDDTFYGDAFYNYLHSPRVDCPNERAQESKDTPEGTKCIEAASLPEDRNRETETVSLSLTNDKQPANEIAPATAASSVSEIPAGTADEGDSIAVSSNCATDTAAIASTIPNDSAALTPPDEANAAAGSDAKLEDPADKEHPNELVPTKDVVNTTPVAAPDDDDSRQRSSIIPPFAESWTVGTEVDVLTPKKKRISLFERQSLLVKHHESRSTSKKSSTPRVERSPAQSTPRQHRPRPTTAPPRAETATTPGEAGTVKRISLVDRQSMYASKAQVTPRQSVARTSRPIRPPSAPVSTPHRVRAVTKSRQAQSSRTKRMSLLERQALLCAAKSHCIPKDEQPSKPAKPKKIDTAEKVQGAPRRLSLVARQTLFNQKAAAERKTRAETAVK